MEFLSTNELSESWKAQLLELWNKEYPTKIAYTSIQELENYLSGLKDPVHILMIDEKGRIISVNLAVVQLETELNKLIYK